MIDKYHNQAKESGARIVFSCGFDSIPFDCGVWFVEEAAKEAFGGYLDGARFDVHRVRFVELIVDELTLNGVMKPGRLYESPYTDHAPTGPDDLFDESAIDDIVEILRDVESRAQPMGA